MSEPAVSETGKSASAKQPPSQTSLATAQPQVQPSTAQGTTKMDSKMVSEAPTKQNSQSLNSPTSPANKLSAVTKEPTLSRQSSKLSAKSSAKPPAAPTPGVQPAGDNSRPVSRVGSQIGTRKGSTTTIASKASSVSKKSDLGRKESSISAASKASHSTAHTRGGTLAPNSPLAEAEPLPVEDEEEDLQGVDWRLTARTANQEVARLQEALAAEKATSSDLERQNSELRSRIADLEATQTESVANKSDAGGGANVKSLKSQISTKERRIRELEAQLANRSFNSVTPDAGGGGGGDALREKDQIISELKDQINALHQKKQLSSDSGYRPPTQALDNSAELRRIIEDKDRQLQECKAAIKQLDLKLDSAQEAIVSATDYGWENDIKLAQARRALVSIMDHHSPNRERKEVQLKNDKVQGLIDSLEEQKKLAVSVENFPEAQRLRDEINVLKGKLLPLPPPRGTSFSPQRTISQTPAGFSP
eukprot:TRINITY_DN22955_c0_g1_i1.p1 TRINITY_DN22955_c0_g1~~TRINITY_DN22955_c0_g1_i1.p1  ORF type:complete len:478 (+),score=121.18 TRINITY_DN22955_c0_g1_i1:78-1511(+)